MDLDLPNQYPEQIPRDKIDQLLIQSGWIVQSKQNVFFILPKHGICALENIEN